ncbi:hypothetical protein CIPAW_05G101600 [Carya illinoinensis]|uniref:Uncharacterized protein n=1 Tax=Carya illinoinensis TaxID=32201 RepID=A0A8T1QHE0_CARIL|nr:hypothetical protein CIPAW_05G101600 [Carya illinoinensis]
MVVVKDSGGNIAKKNVGQSGKKIEPKSPVRRSPRLQKLQRMATPRLQKTLEDQKPLGGCKRKRLSDGLKDQVSEKMTEAGFVEDIVCTSDPRTGHNSGCPPQVDDWNKSAANVKRTLRIFNRFYLRFVQVIIIIMRVNGCIYLLCM